ncbi:unnamed protein product [Rotaria magnacalcarata]|uniref:Translin-associated factor X-interacting protein 1 N-terminal domain-containing protein n=4 Tax=Rotaria magnacalcarata TaxID=392030 RepID=A0A819KN66_9BILA|nr:unnamed protein product [Rotaria magnacalcarata]CAF1646794.1 unnamed protein product [Rotaria magnacalcarata]CAF1951342.1 unnamed protein product [Rotaria magnacalcarata]CAF2056556.1 unnamed protein product [Rotaria magnacalcarata]CAF2217280.1 unnamed protein product [Rotaria magnacalcarata]
MSSQIKKICNSINREQLQSIRDLTSGHLNENHLHRHHPTTNEEPKPCWPSSKKPHLTLRPAHHFKTDSSNVEEMKNTLVDFTYLTLPEIPIKKTPKQKKADEQLASSITSEQLPPIMNERIQVPAFSIDLSEEQRVRKMKTFNDMVLQKNDVNLHGLGYSEDFVAFVEQNLILKLTTIESQNKGQIISLSRLQAYGEAMSQLIEGSVAFGPILERIKDEYELYLDHLLTTQPEYGTQVAEQLKRLRRNQPNFSTADSELFDIEKIEEQTRQALKRNRTLNEELRRIKQEQINTKASALVQAVEIAVTPTEVKIKTQAEQIDDLRQNIFDLFDRIARKKRELTENFVPISVCTQIQQAMRDAEMDVIKTNKQNQALLDELDTLEERIRQEILTYDQSEFAQENVDQIIQLLKKADVLHMKKLIFNEDDIEDQHFLHTYDDYFS